MPTTLQLPDGPPGPCQVGCLCARPGPAAPPRLTEGYKLSVILKARALLHRATYHCTAATLYYCTAALQCSLERVRATDPSPSYRIAPLRPFRRFRGDPWIVAIHPMAGEQRGGGLGGGVWPLRVPWCGGLLTRGSGGQEGRRRGGRAVCRRCCLLARRCKQALCFALDVRRACGSPRALLHGKALRCVRLITTTHVLCVCVCVRVCTFCVHLCSHVQ